MSAEYFIGIVPPEAYMERVEHFREQWMDYSIVEPHITLKAQGGLSPDLKWIERIRKVCENVRPFSIQIAEPAYFGEQVLYLSVHSEALVHLHEYIVREISPTDEQVKKYFELDDFVPHLTLAKEAFGLSKQNLVEMEKAALIKLSPFPQFKVEFIRIYERKTHADRYETFEDIYLNAGA
ncbi:2'-5' RNA ligase family protein [Halobacillus halophilus]|uniref:2'-5' RNA ligase family protein n=1 Tax=Halobacillus halophilus TaxID=1570 RepID=UPI001CD197DF|nr:2'-5' RNA ligase family protein [Halobacillus halophilus]MCA1011630.1 2'-5' RNA ligase family protein [Halobacillus halophilus]